MCFILLNFTSDTIRDCCENYDLVICGHSAVVCVPVRGTDKAPGPGRAVLTVLLFHSAVLLTKVDSSQLVKLQC